MTGEQLYAFLTANLKNEQVLYISSTGGLHRFRMFQPNGNLKFSIPNNAEPNHPNFKSIPQNIIVQARNLYINGIPNEFEDYLRELNWADCRNAILKQLVKIPDYLKGNI